MRQRQWLAVLLGACLLLGSGPAAAGAATLDHHRTVDQGEVSAKALELNQEIRRLWTEHALWTKEFMIDLYSNLPGKDKHLQRLLRNQKDLGDAFKPYYGEEAGNKITQLLTEHIVIGGEVFASIKEKDQNKLNEANKKWFKNADDIAKYLSSLNPNWTNEELRESLDEHLKLLIASGIALSNNSWDIDIEATDKGLQHLLKLADVLSYGIVKQFPKKF